MGAAARAAKVSKARCHHAKSKRPARLSFQRALLPPPLPPPPRRGAFFDELLSENGIFLVVENQLLLFHTGISAQNVFPSIIFEPLKFSKVVEKFKKLDFVCFSQNEVTFLKKKLQKIIKNHMFFGGVLSESF